MPSCNGMDTGSDFAWSEKEQTSDAVSDCEKSFRTILRKKSKGTLLVNVCVFHYSLWLRVIITKSL